MSVSESKVHVAKTLQAALDFLHERWGEGWRPLAGGTDALVPMYRDGLIGDRPWLSLHKLKPQLSYVEFEPTETRIGALTTIAELESHAELANRFPLFRKMCRLFASPAIRNRATVAGNLANASPASDLAPILLAHDAEVELASVRGTRRVALERFWTGYKTDIREPDELIVGLYLPWSENCSSRSIYRKVAPRASNSIAIVNFAAIGLFEIDGTWTKTKLAFGCMGPFPVRARAAESVLAGRRYEGEIRGNVLTELERELRPVSDHRGTAAYRSLVARNLVDAFLSGSLDSAL